MKKIMLVVMMSVMSVVMFAQSVERCSACQGHGAVVCPSCKGYGQVSVYNPYYGCYVNQVCMQCGGYTAVVCGRCCGQGKVVVNNGNNVTFGGKRTTPPNSGSDGYIYQGRSIKVGQHYYDYYKKNGHDYYWNGYSFVRLK